MAGVATASNKKIVKIDIQQLTNSIVVHTEKEYKICSLSSPDDVKTVHYERKEVSIAKLFPGGDYVATVFKGLPLSLHIYHLGSGRETHTRCYPDAILSVHVNGHVVVACLKQAIYIYAAQTMHQMCQFAINAPNPKGLCGLSTVGSFLAYPASETTGQLKIFDAVGLRSKIIILAHEAVLARLAFSRDGEKVVTASAKGTLIRVFSSHNGEKLFEFRRGLTQCVKIRSLGFSPCGQFVYCSSNSATVHIFKCEKSTKPAERGSWFGQILSLLPTSLPSVFTEERAFAMVRLAEKDANSTVSIIDLNNNLVLLVATGDGKLYVYQMQPNNGGELRIHKLIYLNVEETTPDRRRCTEPTGEASSVRSPNMISGNSPRGHLPVTSRTKRDFMAYPRTSTPVND